MRSFFLVGLLAASSVAPASAQMTSAAPNSAVARGAASITEVDVARRVHIIADDSMMGRDTPSRGLEMTAAYVASEFRRVGLKPGGDSGSYLQRYPLVRTRLDAAQSHVGFMAGTAHAHVDFTADARWRYGPMPAASLRGKALVVGGALDTTSFDVSQATDRIVIMVVDYSHPVPAATNVILQRLAQSKAQALIFASNRDSVQFREALARENTARVRLVMPSEEPEGIPIIEVRDGAMAAPLRESGIDVTAVRQATAPVVRPLDGLTVMVEAREVSDSGLSAPNTVGILEGSDPELKHEYVVFSAHMDHVGVHSPRKGSTDSIWNGADDDGSGTTGIMELAEAFTQPGARPRRSLIFLTVSGEEKGLWGSSWFSEHPPVPVTQIVADLNMDMIGRNWKDTIVVIGKEHSDLGATLNRVNIAHPELGMTAIDDIWPDENFYFRSDHFNFARKGVPILFFFNGTHEDYHGPGDEPDKIEAEKEARIIKLVYFLGLEVANADARPKWNPESYKQIVEGAE